MDKVYGEPLEEISLDTKMASNSISTSSQVVVAASSQLVVS